MMRASRERKSRRVRSLRSRPTSLSLASAGLVFAAAGVASAETLRVPDDAPTLQAAIDAASPGAEIRLAAGRHCGARVDKRVVLAGAPGAVIVGCLDGPTVHGRLRVGLLLESESKASAGAAGTVVSGLSFDGKGVADDHLAPLAFGVFGRFVDGVVVSGNVFRGTVQAVTNTAGDRWVITNNRVEGFTAFSCPGLCGGGVGIVVQPAAGAVALPGGSLNPRNRAADNTVADNDVAGRVPEGLDAFSIVGIFVQAADRTVVSRNRVAVTRSPRGGGAAEGITVAAQAGGDPTPAVPGARDTVVEENDGEASPIAVLVENRGVSNTEGLELRDNAGAVVVEDGSPD